MTARNVSEGAGACADEARPRAWWRRLDVERRRDYADAMAGHGAPRREWRAVLKATGKGSPRLRRYDRPDLSALSDDARTWDDAGDFTWTEADERREKRDARLRDAAARFAAWFAARLDTNLHDLARVVAALLARMRAAVDADRAPEHDPPAQRLQRLTLTRAILTAAPPAFTGRTGTRAAA